MLLTIGGFGGNVLASAELVLKSRIIKFSLEYSETTYVYT